MSNHKHEVMSTTVEHAVKNNLKIKYEFAIDTELQFKIVSMFSSGNEYEVSYYDSAIKGSPTLKTVFKGKKLIFCESY